MLLPERQDAGASQELIVRLYMLEDRFREVGRDELALTGIGGKGLSSPGLAGTDRMKDLKDLTGFSIPSSDDEEVLECLNGGRRCSFRF